MTRSGKQFIEIAEPSWNAGISGNGVGGIWIVGFARIFLVPDGDLGPGRHIRLIRKQLLAHFTEFLFHRHGAFRFCLGCRGLRGLGVNARLFLELRDFGGIDFGRRPQFLDILFERAIKLGQIIDRAEVSGRFARFFGGLGVAFQQFLVNLHTADIKGPRNEPRRVGGHESIEGFLAEKVKQPAVKQKREDDCGQDPMPERDRAVRDQVL